MTTLNIPWQDWQDISHHFSCLICLEGTFQVAVCVGPVGFSVGPSNHILNDLQHHLSQRVPWHLLDVLARQFGWTMDEPGHPKWRNSKLQRTVGWFPWTSWTFNQNIQNNSSHQKILMTYSKSQLSPLKITHQRFTSKTTTAGLVGLVLGIVAGASICTHFIHRFPGIRKLLPIDFASQWRYFFGSVG